jgi:hypothetical protein
MHITVSRRLLSVSATVVAALAVAISMAACSHGSGTSGQALDTGISANIEYNALVNQPAPIFQHSDIRATAISIEAIQALGEQTTSFGFNQGIKDPVWSCPSLGEPVAADTEITNPDANYNASYPNGGTSYPIPNMDPNEIYPGTTTGTYVLCVNAQGQPYAQYWEGFVDTVSAGAVWDEATGQIVVSGQPVMPTCTVTSPGQKSAKTTCVK